MSKQGIFALQDEATGNVVLTYHLVEEVYAPAAYVTVMELARLLEETDVFEIIISGNPGGYLSGARALTTIQDSTLAKTEVVAIDELASAATMVAINADELTMTKGSSMMIHTASYGTMGTTPNIKKQVDFVTENIRRTITDYYTDFLTKKEIKRVLHGDEVWLSDEECTERFARVVAKRRKEADKEALLYMIEQRDALTSQLVTMNSVIAENS